MPLLANLSIQPDKTRILARLKYRSGRTEIPKDMSEKIDRVIRTSLSLIEPAGIYEVFSIVSREPENIRLDCGLVLLCPKLAELLASCRRVILMAATIGPEISRRSISLSETDLFEAAILDAAGSELAETAIQAVQTAAMRNIPAGKLTMRFSPGYSGWDLSVQPEILSTLQTGRIGLASNSSHILQPEKSVTAIAGIID
jgi:hypothetical protein